MRIYLSWAHQLELAVELPIAVVDAVPEQRIGCGADHIVREAYVSRVPHSIHCLD